MENIQKVYDWNDINSCKVFVQNCKQLLLFVKFNRNFFKHQHPSAVVINIFTYQVNKSCISQKHFSKTQKTPFWTQRCFVQLIPKPSNAKTENKTDIPTPPYHLRKNQEICSHGTKIFETGSIWCDVTIVFESFRFEGWESTATKCS